MKVNKDVYVVIADMGCPALDGIKKDFPDRIINVGIAEQAMLGMATGLALEGKKVYCYVITSFFLRCLEHIRVNMCGMNLPIVLVGVGAGFGYEDSGFTHHAIEDVRCLESFPKIRIFNPADNNMTGNLAISSVDWTFPSYIRLDRENLPDIYSNMLDINNPEGFNILRDHPDTYILSTGNMVHEAIKSSYGVIDVFEFPRGKINAEKYLKGKTLKYLSEDNVFDVSQFKEGYQYVYGGRERIRNGYGISQAK